MLLVLVDNDMSKISVVDMLQTLDKIEYIVHKNVIRDKLLLESKRGRALKEEEKVKKKFISETVAGNPDCAIRICFERGTRELTVRPEKDLDKSILKRLALHQENVRISVYVQDCSSDMLEVLSAEGMEIDAKTFSCKGNANYESSCELNRKVHITVVAEIAIPVSKGFSFAQKVLEMGVHSDLIIVAGNGTEIAAHKCFLFACSPVLKKMIPSEMEESQLDMSDVSERGVRAFLRYVYCGDLHEPTKNIRVAFELFRVGHKYEVYGLESAARAILLETRNEDISVGLAFKMYMSAKNIESEMELKMKTVQILKAKWDEFESLPEYKNIFEKPSNFKTASELCRDFARTASSLVPAPVPPASASAVPVFKKKEVVSSPPQNEDALCQSQLCSQSYLK